MVGIEHCIDIIKRHRNKVLYLLASRAAWGEQTLLGPPSFSSQAGAGLGLGLAVGCTVPTGGFTDSGRTFCSGFPDRGPISALLSTEYINDVVIQICIVLYEIGLTVLLRVRGTKFNVKLPTYKCQHMRNKT